MGFSLFMVMQTIAVVQAHTADLSDISTSGARVLVVHELNAVLGNLILMRQYVRQGVPMMCCEEPSAGGT